MGIDKVKKWYIKDISFKNIAKIVIFFVINFFFFWQMYANRYILRLFRILITMYKQVSEM